MLPSPFPQTPFVFQYRSLNCRISFVFVPYPSCWIAMCLRL